MAVETILQHWVVTSFILPFLLISFLVFGILEKTKAFGEKSKQLHALVAFVIGLIFVGAIFPKLVVGNLILFFTVAITVLFIVLLLWGFVSGGEAKLPDSKPVKRIVGAVIVLAVVVALLIITGVENTFLDALFGQSWSAELWTNLAFVGVVIAALVLMMKSSGGSK